MKIKIMLNIISVSVLMLFIFLAVGSTDTETDKTSSENSTEKESTSQASSKKEEIDISKVDITKENIIKALSNVLETDKITNIDITEKEGSYIIDVFYKPIELWDEYALVSHTAKKAVDVMEILFKNEKVNKVWFWTQADMTDAKGNSKIENVVNVGLTKENAKDINWSKFKIMVFGDYNALFNIADGKYIHPAIAKNLK